MTQLAERPKRDDDDGGVGARCDDLSQIEGCSQRGIKECNVDVRRGLRSRSKQGRSTGPF
jgi:hypothetical protein